MSTPIYVTGKSHTGQLLVGGAWTMKHEQGLPLEVFNDMVKARGGLVDWCEAMCDASTTDNLPSLMKELEQLLSESEIAHLKRAFSLLVENTTVVEMLARKKAA